MACRSIGKSGYAKRVLMFGIAQPLALLSLPFDVAFNLHNAARVDDRSERLLHWRGLLRWSPPVRAEGSFEKRDSGNEELIFG